MSYTLAYTGAEIDALLGKIDAIFVAEYGSTIYSEVTAAIAAGNKVIVANAGKVFVYAGTDDNSGYVFTQSGPNAAKPNATYVTLSTGNVWSTATVDLATVQQFYASLMEDTASGSIASFPDGAENVPVKEMVIQIEPVQSGSGDPSPDNIRPISGYTGAEITRTGKNLVAGSVVYETGSTEYWKLSETTYLKAGSYTASIYNDSANAARLFVNTIVNGVTTTIRNISIAAHSRGTTAFTLAEDTVVNLSGRFDPTANIPDITVFNRPQIELGSSATDYESNADNTTYSVSWTDHGTVYKGYLIVYADGSGVLVSEDGELNITNATVLTSFTASAQYGSWAFVSTASAPQNRDASVANAMCETALSASWNDRVLEVDKYRVYCDNNSNNIALRAAANDNISTAEDLLAKFVGTKLVYKLATPVTYSLAAVQVKSLLGDNNIWSNTGDISVKYRCNTALYIEKKLGE